ncbi:MAG TPA: PDZ domain-containing protein [Candidatus Sulfotelmatobacter sp.]|jgi:serine protease Do|nr:PDZ domain-containing protein [Candidatus Sulfotelmatobacter sp.]
MHRYVVTGFALLPLLLSGLHATQNVTSEAPQVWAFSSDDSGTSSYLGVDIADITADRLSALKLKEEKGVEVNFVDPDGPAGKSGMKEHDVILVMNGTPVESAAQLRRMIHETPAGRTVTFGLSRDGQPLTLKVQLGDKHKEFAFMGPKPGDIHVQVPEIHIPDIDIPSMNMVVVTSSARSGLMVENITPQLGDFFGVKNGNGVLVRSVEKGSRAERAGFHAGDVIVKINGQPVHDTSDFSHAVKSRNSNSVSVGVMRDRKEQSLTLSLPDRKESSGLFDEESFYNEPMIQAQSALELSKMQSELAKVQPDMELAVANSRKAAEQLSKELCKEKQEFVRQGQKQKEQMQKDMQKLQRELREMSGDWL